MTDPAPVRGVPKTKTLQANQLEGLHPFSWPCMSFYIGCRCRYRSAKAEPDRQGRSSGSRIILPPDPSRRQLPRSGCVRFRPRLQRRDRSRIARDFLLSTSTPCSLLSMGPPPACQDGSGGDRRPARAKPLLEKPRQLCDRIPFPLHQTRGRARRPLIRRLCNRYQPCGGHPIALSPPFVFAGDTVSE